MRGLKKSHGETKSGGQDKRSRLTGTTPADVRSKTVKLPYAKVSVPGVRVALVSEGYPDVKMKEEEDLVEIRGAFAMAIDNLLEEMATTPSVQGQLLLQKCCGCGVREKGTLPGLGSMPGISLSFDMIVGLRLKTVSIDELLEHKELVNSQ